MGKFNFCEPSERSVCEFILSNYTYRTLTKMTFWADNIKFIKDVLDSKYKKVEDSLADLEEHVAELGKDPDNKKIKDLFKEAASCLELVNADEMAALAETMFAEMPDNEKGKEKDRLDSILQKQEKGKALITANRQKYNIGK